MTFQSDLFHPLVTPLTTYTHSTISTDTQSAVDEQRLPPGGLSLRHGFPEWFAPAGGVAIEAEVGQTQNRPTEHDDEQEQHKDAKRKDQRTPHVVELLHYVRVVFDTEDVLDAIPLNAAANTGAWHAWKSYRTKAPAAGRGVSVARSLGDGKATSVERSVSPRQQPGGARRPGEWNWQGVWEERVRRSVQTTLAEPVLFGGDSDDVVGTMSRKFDGMSTNLAADQFPEDGSGGSQPDLTHEAGSYGSNTLVGAYCLEPRLLLAPYCTFLLCCIMLMLQFRHVFVYITHAPSLKAGQGSSESRPRRAVSGQDSQHVLAKCNPQHDSIPGKVRLSKQRCLYRPLEAMRLIEKLTTALRPGLEIMPSVAVNNVKQRGKTCDGRLNLHLVDLRRTCHRKLKLAAICEASRIIRRLSLSCHRMPNLRWHAKETTQAAEERQQNRH